MTGNTQRARVKVFIDQEQQPEKRPRGRPKGTVNKLSLEAIEWAKQTGELPHQFLLRVSQGQMIATEVLHPDTGEVKVLYHIPDFETRVDAAKSAAPYFAPKLSAVQMMQQVADDQLDEIIKGLAAEADVSLGELMSDPVVTDKDE
jgi:hypothetical protein